MADIFERVELGREAHGPAAATVLVRRDESGLQAGRVRHREAELLQCLDEVGMGLTAVESAR